MAADERPLSVRAAYECTREELTEAAHMCATYGETDQVAIQLIAIGLHATHRNQTKKRDTP